jgi:hypothetical protein
MNTISKQVAAKAGFGYQLLCALTAASIVAATSMAAAHAETKEWPPSTNQALQLCGGFTFEKCIKRKAFVCTTPRYVELISPYEELFGREEGCPRKPTLAMRAQATCTPLRPERSCSAILWFLFGAR